MEVEVEVWTDLRAELRQLVGLGVEPVQGLHVLQVGVGGQGLGAGVQSHGCSVNRCSADRCSVDRYSVDR